LGVFVPVVLSVPQRSAQRIAIAHGLGAILLRRKQDRVAMVAGATCPFALLSALAMVVIVLGPPKIRETIRNVLRVHAARQVDVRVPMVLGVPQRSVFMIAHVGMVAAAFRMHHQSTGRSIISGWLLLSFISTYKSFLAGRIVV